MDSSKHHQSTALDHGRGELRGEAIYRQHAIIASYLHLYPGYFMNPCDDRAGY